MRFHIKAPTRSVSRKHACKSLHISLSEFNELSLLLDILPQQFKNKHKFDHGDKLQYRIEDIQKMIDSDAYLSIINRNKVLKRREEYIKKKRVERLKKLKEVEFSYVKLVKERFVDFYDSVIKIGESLDILFLVRNVIIKSILETKNEIKKNEKKILIFLRIIS
ncbi:mRNA-binding ribosome synthesis protein nop7 [Gurleya vavrai]